MLAITIFCDNHRIKSNKSLLGSLPGASRQWVASVLRWFYGFNAHLVINQYGELINFVLTSGNVADNNKQVLTELLADLQGQCFADRGYLTKLFSQFYEQGLQLVTKLRRKMKNTLMVLGDKLKLRSRGLIESVNDLLTSVFDVEHTHMWLDGIYYKVRHDGKVVRRALFSVIGLSLSGKK